MKLEKESSYESGAVSRGTLAFFLTLFVNILCLPLWTEYDYGGFVWTLFNREARLDLLYHGKITGAEPFHCSSIPKPFYATWKYDPEVNVHRKNLILRARGKWQKISLQLKALRNGKITMIFGGPDKRDDYGHFYPVLTDWRNCKINGKDVFSETKLLSYQKSFSKQISVQKDEILHIEMEFRRHHFTINDFTFLKRGTLWYLLTGNVLFFFLTCRLLSLFNKCCGYIRLSDALLVATFSSLVFIPMIGISGGVKSVRENRMLAVKPKMKEILEGKINTGGGYEKWFNDHMGGRTSLIKLHDVIRNKLSHTVRTRRAVYFKEEEWTFRVPFVLKLDCKQPFIRAILQNLIQLNRFCQQNKIKLYVLECPKKEYIYKKFLSNKYGFDEKQFVKVSRAQEAVRNGAQNHDIPYVYPYDKIREATKQDFVFFKCSHHLTDWGAFIGYRELMKEIRKDFPDISVASLEDFRKSQNWLQRDHYTRCYSPMPYLYKDFNTKDTDNRSPRTFYNYYDHKNGNKMAVHVGKFTKDFIYQEGKYKIMLIGTSQNDMLSDILAYSAAQTKYIRLNMGQVKTADEFKILKLYKKDILVFKPDILILSIHTNDLPRLRDISSTK